MAKNEDGEFEVMVGNKQLLSILFVLMVMFGIVFTMGYFVGRNSTAETAATQPSPAPVSSEGRPEPAPAAAPPAADSTAPADANPPVAGDTAAAPATQTVPVGGTPQQQPPAAAKPDAPPAQAAAGPVPPGTYLQVTAIKQRPDAEMFVEALKRKGLPAIVGDSVSRNGEEFYRVLVGPYNDPASLARARSDIETLLKYKVFVRKY